jgi:hypothetical protein
MKRLLITVTVAAAIVPSAAGVRAAAEPPQLTLLGETSLASAAAPEGIEADPVAELQGGFPGSFRSPTVNAIRLTRFPSRQIPTPSATPLAAANLGFAGFDGLNHRDQRFADNGNQISQEPPDQALCVGRGYVIEAVNTALAVYSPTGARLAAPVSLHRFYGLPSEFDRRTGRVGPLLSDPRCYFDPDTQRWFVVATEIDRATPFHFFPLGDKASMLIAVSTTSDPRATFRVYRLDVTDADGTPQHAGCPCFGDFSGVGADATGFYISTNEINIAFENGTAPLILNGAQIYAMSKRALEAGTLPPVAHLDGFDLGNGGFTIRPASSPNGVYETAGGGTEYLVSAFPFGGIDPFPFANYVDHRLAVWALTNTSSLATAAPSLSLTRRVVDVEDIAIGPDAEQKPGPLPLADILAQFFQLQPGEGPKEHLAVLEGVGRIPSQVVYAAGKLWTAMDTGVRPPTGPTRIGAAWLVLAPSLAAGSLDVAVANQGYLAVSQANVMNPAIAVNDAGQAAMGFTLTGPDFFPSAAYVTLDPARGVGPVHVAAAGVAPEDAFSGYRTFGSDGVARWGDYGAAVADQDGNLWLATEYISPRPRSLLANWGTFVSRVNP